MKDILQAIENSTSLLANSKSYYDLGKKYELLNKYDNAYLCFEYALILCTNFDDVKLVQTAINSLTTSHSIDVRKCSIVILTYNNLDYTKVCIDSIRKYNSTDTCEIVIIDNNSTDGTVEWIKNQTNIKYLLNDENVGFPTGCNQGIKLAEENNDIFLLNNDTVIMPNSIFNLRMGLYSDTKVGATGAVSNSVSYYQQILETYNTFQEYIYFALKNNITNEGSYEKRIKLVGFALLLKRTVLNKIGLLDERFTPGNFEDDDISFRIIMEGYDLLLCKDSYIHHFGSISFRNDITKYSKLLKDNSIKFKEKWGFNAENETKIRYDLLEKINLTPLSKNTYIYVLEIGCGMGATSTILRTYLPNTIFYGVENNDNIIKTLNNSNIFESIQSVREINFQNITFDIIICSKECMSYIIKSLEKNITHETQIIGGTVMKNQTGIEFTGERLVINDFVKANLSDVMYEHINRYKLASNYVKDKVVIDAACGTGYGSCILSQRGALSVKGFDISEEAIQSAMVNYSEYENVSFELGDVTTLKMPNNSAEVFVSFETIEHIPCGTDLIKEAYRVLDDNGIFIVSTPNRNATNPGLLSNEKPANIFHTFEYSALQFIGELSSLFDVVEVFGQTLNENLEFAKNLYIRQIFGKPELNYKNINNIKDYECRKIGEFKDFDPMYIVCVCRKKAYLQEKKSK